MLALLSSLAPAAGCERSAEGPAPTAAIPAAAPGEELPPLPVVRKGTDTLLFSFVDVRGRIQATGDMDAVPDDVKRRVLVVDLARSPEERQAHRYAFFTDLTAAGPDGTYPVTVVTRYDVAAGQSAPALLPSVPEGTVIVYSAVWCGFCQKAKAWLKERNVPFVERDVEKTPGAQAELSRKLQEAGIQGGGIPVIDWGGELVMGFAQGRLEQLLKDKPPAAAP